LSEEAEKLTMKEILNNVCFFEEHRVNGCFLSIFNISGNEADASGLILRTAQNVSVREDAAPDDGPPISSRSRREEVLHDLSFTTTPLEGILTLVTHTGSPLCSSFLFTLLDQLSSCNTTFWIKFKTRFLKSHPCPIPNLAISRKDVDPNLIL
jgi:hypothetical protein